MRAIALLELLPGTLIQLNRGYEKFRLAAFESWRFALLKFSVKRVALGMEYRWQTCSSDFRTHSDIIDFSVCPVVVDDSLKLRKSLTYGLVCW